MVDNTPRPRSDGGYTLAELMVVMIIVGLLGALGTAGWTRYQRASEFRTASQTLVSALRNVQQASLSEAVTYCVSFDAAANTYATYKYQCGGTGTLVKTIKANDSSRVRLTTPAFLQPDGATSSQVQFFPRGSATKGSVKLHQASTGKSKTINIEGLTGRVSLSG